MGKMMGLGWVPQSETLPLRNEAPLNCVALRSSLDYEVAWRAVKGQDERQKTAPLTALHATWDLAATSEKNMEGRHVGLDFYDLLIEVHPFLSRMTGCEADCRIRMEHDRWRQPPLAESE